MARAQRHVRAAPRFDPSPERRRELAAQFFAAVERGDVARLERLLAEDVAFYGDGGGKAPTIGRPVLGTVNVARFLVGLSRVAARVGGRVERVQVNGQPGARFCRRTARCSV